MELLLCLIVVLLQNLPPHCQELEQITKPLLNHVSIGFHRHTHYTAFNNKADWYMMSTFFEGHIMKLIIECAMSMQTSHGLSSLLHPIF